MNKILWKQIGAALLMVLLLAACGGQEAAQEPTQEPTAAVIDKPTQVPTQEPTVAVVEAEATASTAADETTAEETQPAAEAVPATNSKLNPNEASGDEYLATIPDFSSRMVREFLEYRPYVSIQRFRREIGKYVDNDIIAGYEEYVMSRWMLMNQTLQH